MPVSFTAKITATLNTATQKWEALARVTQDGAEFSAPVHLMSGEGHTLCRALGDLQTSVWGFSDGLSAAADFAGGLDALGPQGQGEALYTEICRLARNLGEEVTRAGRMRFGEKVTLPHVTITRC